MLSNADDGERQRLAAIEAAYDPGTKRHLVALGVGHGSRVLVAGAGGGSIVRWAAEVVGLAGEVVAVDIDTRFVEPLAQLYPNVRVVRQDVVTEDLPGGGFDAACARLLLGHLPQREAVLAKLAATLVPGGGLLVEDFDWGSYGPAEPNAEAEKAIEVVSAFVRSVGFDTAFGRRLPGVMRRAGLAGVDAEGLVLTLRGETFSLEPMFRQTFERLLPRLIETGQLTEGEAAALHKRFDDPEHDMCTQTLMSVWGRRPFQP
ncbi:methyltransferase domain-containing protein [Streptomyces sp. NBC_00459]|uniref:methyltransferase domain-containing protein n=1 Tax=Streptomyces sp. NBC_00459 TaxID=2975749 RepID=UPI002E192203